MSITGFRSSSSGCALRTTGESITERSRFREGLSAITLRLSRDLTGFRSRELSARIGRRRRRSGRERLATTLLRSDYPARHALCGFFIFALCSIDIFSIIVYYVRSSFYHFRRVAQPGRAASACQVQAGGSNPLPPINGNFSLAVSFMDASMKDCGGSNPPCLFCTGKMALERDSPWSFRCVARPFGMALSFAVPAARGARSAPFRRPDGMGHFLFIPWYYLIYENNSCGPCRHPQRA